MHRSICFRASTMPETLRTREVHVKVSAFILSAALVVPTTPAAQTTISAKQSPIADNERLFLHALASEDHSEIDLAKLALHQSHNPQIKQYARSKILAADPSMEQQAAQSAQQLAQAMQVHPGH
jgi:predicted outer membrane protein